MWDEISHPPLFLFRVTMIIDLYNKLAGNMIAPIMAASLAHTFSVEPGVLARLGLGYYPIKGTYAMPERDSNGDIIGITLRCHNGKKFMEEGSKRGLFYEVNPEYNSEQMSKGNYVSGKQNWVRIFAAGVTCPICGKPDYCLVSAENPADPMAVMCTRCEDGAEKDCGDSGFLHIRKPEGRIHSDGGLLPRSEYPIVITEGYSDTAAAMDLGFVAVGRPSANGGLALLPDLVSGREVIIVGDNDAGAGAQGVEATFQALKSFCPKLVKVFPPKEFKDLRQWKSQTGLTIEEFANYVVEHGDTNGDQSIFETDVAHHIAKQWLEQECTQDSLPTIRCYRGQWMKYEDGHYKNCGVEEFRGSIYRFLDGKQFLRTDNVGVTRPVPYKPSRSKVTDIIDALSDWCTISDNPPTWIADRGLPGPSNLVAFRNGLLDINEYINGKIVLYDPTPALFTMNTLPYDYNEDAESPLFEESIKEIFGGDETKLTLLSQWMGYLCTPDMQYEKMMLFTGRPRSGKGTVLHTMAAMLGDEQCASTSFQSLTSQFGYQALIGKLAVFMGDAKIPRTKEMSSALEKLLQIIGRDPVGINRKFLSTLAQVYLTCRFTIAMNDLPDLPDQANALEPRLNVIHFENSYVGREDPTLKLRLRQEAEKGKLINFALRGLKSLREARHFVKPPSSEPLVRQLRELTQPVSVFVGDCCECEPPCSNETYYVTIDRLYDAWTHWCEESGRKPGIKEQFGRWFISAVPQAQVLRQRVGGRRYRCYTKIRLADWVKKQWFGE